MNKSIKDLSESEFNKYMIQRLVKEGKASSLTPSKTTWIKMKDANIGKISFGSLSDVPSKERDNSNWDDVAGTSDGGTKGGTSGPAQKTESMWANRNLDPSIMVFIEPDPKRLRVKLNKNNKDLTDLFITGMDSKYISLMDELIDEMFVYLRSVATMLRECETKIKDIAISEDYPYEDDNNYFLDKAFKNWWSDSKSVNKLVTMLTDKKKDI
jgi:hypothetical protein